MKLERSRPEACLSDFALDRRLAKELEGEEAAAADTHIAECTRCEGRAAELLRERDEFAKAAPALRAAPRRLRFTGRAASALALAAAVVLFVAFRGPRPDTSGTRTKGDGAKLGFYVNHNGSVRLGGPNERVAPGDGLRFVVSAREERYLTVVSVDGMRHVSVYYPSETDAARVAAGENVALPQSTTLDDTLGDETIYGIFCEKPQAVEPLRRAMEVSPERPPVMQGCTVDTLHVHKEAPAPP